MDLNNDGHVDILSGSYSRPGRDMAGLIQVFWGKQGGGFDKCTVLNGTDGNPLIITCDKKKVTDRICTRPTAADLNGDGKLDLIVGNFTGTFAFFKGEGNGKFSPESTWLGIKVHAHGDPCIVDWDGDGDLDIVSGAAHGGVYLFPNGGTKTAPKFNEKITLLEGVQYSRKIRFGDAHLKGPQRDTRVWVDDVNGDGKLDLLIGDSVALEFPAKGLDEAAAREGMAEWKKEEKVLAKAFNTKDPAERKKAQKDYSAHYKNRAKFVRQDRTGFVWVLYQQ